MAKKEVEGIKKEIIDKNTVKYTVQKPNKKTVNNTIYSDNEREV